MDRVFNYIIPTEYEGRRISEYLCDLGYSEKILIRLRKDDRLVLVNNEPSFLNRILNKDDRLVVILKEIASSEKILPVNLPLEIAYEDEDIVVVNKPAKMPIHPSLNNYDNTLGNALAYRYRSEGEEFVYRCVNRLDRDTTGLTIVAKNMLAAAILYDEMINRKIERTYYAIVMGEFACLSGTIDLPIGRKEGSTIERIIDYEHGDEAITHYEVIKQGNGLSFVSLKLDTGRTHQIRVHMKAMGHPLLGDFLYNPDDNMLSRQALHAGKLSFTHPISGEEIILVAKIPADMEEIISRI